MTRPFRVTDTDEVQEIANKAVTASHDLQRASARFRQGWDAAWVNQLNAFLAITREENQSFNVAGLPGALQNWWNQLDDGLQVAVETRDRYLSYRITHPNALLSDEMSVRRAEWCFGVLVCKVGGLGTIQGMGQISSSLSLLADDYFRHDNLASGVCDSVERFAKRALPVILTYTRYLGAKITRPTTG